MIAYLVFGPESSGNRLMTRILVGCGCFGDGDHRQRLNTAPPPPGVHIAWHRSVPYAKGWPDLCHLIDIVRAAGYMPMGLVMTRDINAVAHSQVNAPHVPDLEIAHKHITRAYRLIFDSLNKRDTPFCMVSYESLSNPGYLAWLLEHLGLELKDELEPIENRNLKYYDQQNVDT